MNKENKNSILKIFLFWTKIKFIVHISEKKVYPKTKEIWWISIGQNIGVEINGKNKNFERPVLVIKVFNNLGVLVAPISSAIKRDKYCINFINNDKEENIINMSQIRSVSTKRFIRKVGSLKNEDFEKVKRLFKTFV